MNPGPAHSELTAMVAETVTQTEVIGEVADVVVVIRSEEPAPPSQGPEQAPLPSSAPTEILAPAPVTMLAPVAPDILSFQPTSSEEPVFVANPISLVPPQSEAAAAYSEMPPAGRLNPTVRHARHWETTHQRRAA